MNRFISTTSSSWEQTNIDFYQVIAIRGCTMQLRQLDQQITEDGYMCGTTVPIPNAFKGKALSHRMMKDYFRIDSYRTAWKWDGQHCLQRLERRERNPRCPCQIEFYRDFAPYLFLSKERYPDGRLGVVGGFVYHDHPDLPHCFIDEPFHGWMTHT